MKPIMYFDEVFVSINRHKKRSLIASITVAWGLMILILLAGIGLGFQKGILNLFSDYTAKSIWVYSDEASITGETISKGEQIYFTLEDIMLIQQKFTEIIHISPVFYPNVKKISSTHKTLKRFTLMAVDMEYFYIKKLKVKEGRLFNINDNKEKVAIIGLNIANALFNNIRCLGQIIFIEDTGYKVIGVLSQGNFFTENALDIYIPIEAGLNQLSLKRSVDEFALTINKEVDIKNFQSTLHAFLSRYKGFHKKDKTAIFFENVENMVKSFNMVFKGVNIFLWFIGISLLVSGMLSVFNIMTVIVNERIGEFGIRKAIGASPSNIQFSVLIETLIITLISGIAGIIAGLLLVAVVNNYLSSQIIENDLNIIIKINYLIILGALILLTFSGCIAGIIPARRAAKILPAKALRKLET